MINLKPSRKLNIILICLAAVFFVLGGVAYYFLSQQVGQLQTQVDGKQQELDQSQQLAERLAAIEERYRASEAEVSFLEKSLPTRAYTPTLLQQVERLAKGEKLRVIAVRPRVAAPPPGPSRSNPDGSEAAKKEKEQQAQEEEKAPYDKLEIELALSGKYFNAVNFVQKLTRFPKILSVSSFSIRSSNRGRENDASLDITLNLVAYILKEKPEAAGNSKEGGNSHEA